MYERFILTTDLEREATKHLVRVNFPAAELAYVLEPEDSDFMLDMNLPVDKVVFFRFAATTHGPARLLLYSCYHMSLELYNPPNWMAAELRRLHLENIRYQTSQ